MIGIDQHIEELRAELRGCMDGAEIALIEREMEAALAQKRALDDAFGAEISTQH